GGGSRAGGARSKASVGGVGGGRGPLRPLRARRAHALGAARGPATAVLRPPRGPPPPAVARGKVCGPAARQLQRLRNLLEAVVARLVAVAVVVGLEEIDVAKRQTQLLLGAASARHFVGEESVEVAPVREL